MWCCMKMQGDEYPDLGEVLYFYLMYSLPLRDAKSVHKTKTAGEEWGERRSGQLYRADGEHPSTDVEKNSSQVGHRPLYSIYSGQRGLRLSAWAGEIVCMY